MALATAFYFGHTQRFASAPDFRVTRQNLHKAELENDNRGFVTAPFATFVAHKLRQHNLSSKQHVFVPQQFLRGTLPHGKAASLRKWELCEPNRHIEGKLTLPVGHALNSLTNNSHCGQSDLQARLVS
eukprot:6463890-Amphidinium_carterae.2